MTIRQTLTRLILGAVVAAPLLSGMAAPAIAQPMPGPGVPGGPPPPPGFRPVPPPMQEAPPPPPPGPHFVWAPGHWTWNGYRYVWVRGHYVRRHHGWHSWQDGHWAVIGGAWQWVPGHWN